MKRTYINNTLSTYTTTSNPLTLTFLTLYTFDTFCQLYSPGTHNNIIPTKLRRYITLLNINYIFSPLQNCTPEALISYIKSQAPDDGHKGARNILSIL